MAVNILQQRSLILTDFDNFYIALTKNEFYSSHLYVSYYHVCKHATMQNQKTLFSYDC